MSNKITAVGNNLYYYASDGIIVYTVLKKPFITMIAFFKSITRLAASRSKINIVNNNDET